MTQSFSHVLPSSYELLAFTIIHLRNPLEAARLDEELAKQNKSLDAAIFLDAPEAGLERFR